MTETTVSGTAAADATAADTPVTGTRGTSAAVPEPPGRAPAEPRDAGSGSGSDAGSDAGSDTGQEAATVGHPLRTFLIVGTAMFMAQLDNLVVTSALPSIQKSLHAGLSGLQWTISAYTLTFAVFLLSGATLGDRYGRKRLFGIGLTVFTLGSVGSALAPNIGTLIGARAIQGLGGAIMVPLTLTMLSAAVRPERRGLALGGWGALAGVAVALGPVIGGGVTEAASWQWIFWINVPLGLVLLPLSRFWLAESRGPARKLDLPGIGLASIALFGLVYALIRGGQIGWAKPEVVGGFVLGAALFGGFLAWEARTAEPMLPLALFRGRSFSLVNVASMLMFFGMFGSVFFLIQLFQDVDGLSPLASGVRALPWTAVPMLAAPIAGVLSDRIGGRTLVGLGLLCQAAALAWLAAAVGVHTPYSHLVPGLVLGGIGNGLFFAPIANLLLGSVRREQEGVASGVNNAIREFGGVLGVAVMGAIFAARGGYGRTATLSAQQHFVNGLIPAVYTGAAVLLVASATIWALPRRAAASAG